MNQTKVFRKVENNQSIFKLIDYPSNTPYLKLIGEQKSEGYRQVILSSNIMIGMMKRIFLLSKIALKNIKLNEFIDEDLKESISRLVESSYYDKSEQIKLINQLSWASEYESIDLLEVTIIFEDNEQKKHIMKILNNGIMSGTGHQYIYEKLLKFTLQENFNGLT